ncbi:predicted protein [Coccidioides posadasii str. Silveira]|uniref:Predicted protein n=2 Tax=Coccidioides posadasii TaxID=199306 RepID=E9CSB8_COCPS|nr:predicted protein [Coccidioides posadasii str. Silveira]
MSTVSIIHCFNRALFPKRPVQLDPEDDSIMEITIIQNLMNIQHFLNPADEVVEDSPEAIEQHVIVLLDPADESEEDEDLATEMLPLITPLEALDLVKRLQLYEEQQDQGDQQLIQQLNSYESKIAARRLQTQQQQDIRAYFQCAPPI